jgi:hypothetical protein
MAKTPCVGDVLDDATTTRSAMFRQEHAPQSLFSCCLIRDALGAAKMRVACRACEFREELAGGARALTL